MIDGLPDPDEVLDSPIFCCHANEAPYYCPCPAGCWCNKNEYRMCWGVPKKPRVQCECVCRCDCGIGR